MSWNPTIKGFKSYLQLERSLSENSIEAYLRDVEKLASFVEMQGINKAPEKLDQATIEAFLVWVSELGMNARSQARILSGIKAFYKYLLLEDIIDQSPTALLESPKVGRKLPEVLSIDEINELIGAIDLSKPEGTSGM